LQEYDALGDGVMLPVLREGAPPPCSECPKGGPENDERYRLSERNYEAWAMYEKLQSTGGAYLIPEHLRHCELFASHMWLVRRSLEAGRAKAQAEAYKRASEDRE